MKRSTAHLKKLSPGVALEVIRRLKTYYLKHGIQARAGGLKFR